MSDSSIEVERRKQEQAKTKRTDALHNDEQKRRCKQRMTSSSSSNPS